MIFSQNVTQRALLESSKGRGPADYGHFSKKPEMNRGFMKVSQYATAANKDSSSHARSKFAKSRRQNQPRSVGANQFGPSSLSNTKEGFIPSGDPERVDLPAISEA